MYNFKGYVIKITENKLLHVLYSVEKYKISIYKNGKLRYNNMFDNIGKAKTWAEHWIDLMENK